MSKESALAAAQSAPIAPIPEKVVTEAAVPVAPAEMQSSVFAKLAAKEAKLVKDREEFKAQQEQASMVLKMAEEFEDLKKTDRLAALKKLGFSDNDLFEVMATNETKPEETIEEKVAKATKSQLDEYAKSQEQKQAETQQKQNEEIIARHRASITKVYETDKDKYVLSNHYGEAATQLAYDLTVEVLQKEGKVISAQEAADLVEGYYNDHYATLSSLKAPKVVEPAPGTEVVQFSAKKPESKTLTNNVVASSAALASRALNRETRDQKRERLIKQLSDSKSN